MFLAKQGRGPGPDWIGCSHLDCISSLGTCGGPIPQVWASSFYPAKLVSKASLPLPAQGQAGSIPRHRHPHTIAHAHHPRPHRPTHVRTHAPSLTRGRYSTSSLRRRLSFRVYLALPVTLSTGPLST